MSQLGPESSTHSAELEIIEFYIDELDENGKLYRSYYGMNVAKVIEIIRLPTVTGVPGKHHPAALGTFNLRGRVLPLVDLGLWLNKELISRETAKVIVSEFSSVVTAFIVSGVTRIHRMTWAQVEPPGKYLQSFSHDSITGVVRFDKRIVFLLDMEQVIASMDPSVRFDADLKLHHSVQGKGYHVLVADDSPAIRNAIASCLERAEFKITKTTCGKEAWDQLLLWNEQAKNENIPICSFVDLVITDIEMPEMDGHLLTKLIKGHPDLKDLPVVLFSSLISDVVRAKGVAAGADDQIAKPDLPELSHRALALIAKSREAQLKTP